MAHPSPWRASWLRTIAATLALASATLILPAVAADADEKKGPEDPKAQANTPDASKPGDPTSAKPDDEEKAKKKAERQAKAKAKAKALANKAKAIANKAKKAEDEKPKGKLPERPSKVVAKPTLNHEELDSLLDKALASEKVTPATLTNDVEFVRRIYLDMVGKLPTPEQARAFVQTTEKDKRGKLIEHLLISEDFSKNWARYWRDVIRFHATTQNANRIHYDKLEEWLTSEFSRNAPWDDVARGIITATGRDDEQGAVNFALAHEAKPVEIAGEVSRIFLGVQIQCAQCHDHPTDSWKQQQFHEFAAYFAGIRQRRVEKPGMGQRAVFEVITPGKPRYTMPDKNDPQKQIFVAPKFFLDPKAEVLGEGFPATDRLATVASYVTGQDNPWFAKAFVNRIWYALMGEGFYNPVDDIGPERTARTPEVLDALASEFQKGGYDVRWLFRVILNSRAYQREVRSTYTASGRTSFASVCPSRLRADQILDSLAQVLNLPIGNNANANANDKAMAKGKGGKDADAALAKELKGAVAKTKGAQRNGGARGVFISLFGVDPSTPNDDVLGTIPQALFLMNSPLINNAIRANNKTVLGQILAANPDNRDALNALYIRTLSREPTAKEVQVCGRYLDRVGDRQEAFEDILWSLINSTEFITRR